MVLRSPVAWRLVFLVSSVVTVGCAISDGEGPRALAAGGTGGGGAGTGGGGSGGDAGMGGGKAGGGGMGGGDDCTVAFTAPVDNETLDINDDADGDECQTGFQYDVVVTTSAPSGSTATLYAGTQAIADATVMGGTITFPDAQLLSQGMTDLRVVVDEGCEGTINVNVDCNVPECTISAPIVSETHPELNGVPAELGGDRVSDVGSPYQVRVEVDTTIEDGEIVTLAVNGVDTGLMATATAGKAVFETVTLDPDGDYSVVATCTDFRGRAGVSMASAYTVDTVAPPLTVNKVTGGVPGTQSALANGDRFTIDDDVNAGVAELQFRICGLTNATEAPDAVGLPATLGTGQNNFCVGLGTDLPTCVPATAGGAGSGADGACVDLTCPGTGALSLTATLTDDAGNPTQQTFTSISCASDRPAVTWQAPVAGSKLAGAASISTDPTVIKDADAAAAGWQGTLSVCTGVDVVAFPTASVQFSSSVNGAIGTPVTLDANGCASLAGATVGEGDAVTLTATVSAPELATGTASISVPVDVTAPDAPSGISASVLDRRQTSFTFSWTAPADAVTYDVRVRPRGTLSTADAPINEVAEFEAPTTTVVAYTGAPANQAVASNLLIETDYFFAVRAVDDLGNVGSIAAATDAARADFLEQTLLGAGTEAMGNPVDGTADLNGDGFSDLVVGTVWGNTVRIFFGGPDGVTNPTAPVTITGPAAFFGAALAVVGDINGGGAPDIAIGSPFESGGTEGAVYLFYGESGLTGALTAANANIVIRPNATTDPAFASAGFGWWLARLGDFDGDGREDLAIGAPFYGTASAHGSVTIISGATVAAATGSAVDVTALYGAGAVRIDGDVADPQANFGWQVLGLGNFYSTERTDLVVAAHRAGGRVGRAYAFAGQSLAGVTTLGVADAEATFTGPPDDDATTFEQLGENGLQHMGLPFGASGKAAIGFPQINIQGGQAIVTTGTTSPFETTIAWLRAAESTTPGAKRFARMLVGGGISGTNESLSIIGDARPDIVAGTLAGGNARLFFIRGERWGTLPTTNGGDTPGAEQYADIVYDLPDPWADFGRNVSPVRDLNNDDYVDIAVSEVNYTAPNIAGRVLLLY
jgi:hypothetical protein